MTFAESVSRNMGPMYFFRIQGRASRSEYWWFTLFAFLVSVVAGLIEGIFPGLLGAIIGFCISLSILPPSIGVSVRRLHDLNLSGLWILAPIGLYALSFLSLYGTASLLLFYVSIALLCLVSIAFLILMCWPGLQFANRYGEPMN